MTAAEYRELTETLLKLIRREYAVLGDIRKMTDELGEALGRDDSIAVTMSLKMRGEAMQDADKLRKKQKTLIEGISGDMGGRLRALADGKAQEDMSEDEEAIVNVRLSCTETLKKTVQQDKIISRRLAGENSFYVSNADSGADNNTDSNADNKR